MKRRGFTVVELTIIIVVMAILLALGMAGLRSSMLQARNDERRTNAEIFARGLETYYLKADNRYTTSPRAGNRYPSLSDQMHAVGWSMSGYNPEQVPGGYPNNWLTGVPERIVNRSRSMYWVPGNSLGGGGTTTTMPNNSAAVQADSGNTLDTIVYEAIKFYPADGWGGDRFGMCLAADENCTSFNVYYQSENLNGTKNIHVIKSKRQ